MNTHARTRVSGAAAAVATAGLAIATVGLVAPAEATSAALTYDCNAPVIGSTPFTVVNDSNAPATMFVGQSKALTITSKVTIPSSMVGLLYAVGGRTADGTATAQGTLGGRATSTTLKVPTTTIPQSSDLTVTATGPGGTFKATKPGTVTLAAGDFTSTLNIYDTNGDPLSGISPATVPCTAPSGVSTTFDKITVKKDTTATKVAAANVRKGKKASVKVTVRSTHGTTPTGKVKVQVKKGKKTVETKTVTLKKGNASLTLPKKLKKKGTYTVAAKYAGSGTLVTSSGTHKFKVK
ncbi:MAG TPA: DUF6801 domain-containing protein [Marmoricola sp.]